MPEREVRYCTTKDDVRIAYMEEGKGTPLVVASNILASHLGYTGGVADLLASTGNAASHYRVVRYDARGTGMSGRKSLDFSLEARLADLRSVIDHLALERFTLLGMLHSTATAVSYAVANPDRVTKLVLFNPYASGADARQYLKKWDSAREMADEDWDEYTLMMANANFRFRNSERASALAERYKAAMSPQALQAFFASLSGIDTRGILTDVAVPTLVISNETMTFPAEWHQEVAARIPGSRLVQTGQSEPGEWWGLPEAKALAEFLGYTDTFVAEAGIAPTLRTVLFTDLVGHTEMMSRLGDEAGRAVLRQHEAITRDVLKQHGGTEIKTMGDGFMASFASVTKAVECAIALQRAFEQRNTTRVGVPLGDVGGPGGPAPGGGAGDGHIEPLSVRVGLNAGEPIEEDGDLFGATVILASRIAAKAEGGEILVADTVRGLCSGKGFLFNDRGEHPLKGFEDPVRLYQVNWTA
jgi:class 3 adenylate cyclase